MAEAVKKGIQARERENLIKEIEEMHKASECHLVVYSLRPLVLGYEIWVDRIRASRGCTSPLSSEHGSTTASTAIRKYLVVEYTIHKGHITDYHNQETGNGPAKASALVWRLAEQRRMAHNRWIWEEKDQERRAGLKIEKFGRMEMNSWTTVVKVAGKRIWRRNCELT
ncbi:uncharacterized protein BDR25DRAFT_315229 [Lindgomyces ingoldianus]|uniref:Uncharacterized protein n=1 Tax=Lindgomyces ingoldianus TaxID=673940 RepID=A0ACB6QT06_9PLEO|nr:uncharacterized protein BDR25DRAFT_315229 [Lindgomyces ingoldianus]KAF2469645.1 hypothetical protein BDR25DRAFT_315229 [Lindgomyces ingoldianus]